MDKKNRILLTTLELVAKQGVHATPVSQIARESKVAVGTIYHYFDCKEAILREIYRMIRKDFAVILTPNKEDKTREDIFKTYWRNLYHYYTSNPLAFEFYEFIARPPIIPQKLIEETKAYYIDHAQYFLNGTKDGTLKNMNISLLVQIAVNTVVAAVSLKLNKSVPMNEKQLNDAANAAWDAIRFIKN